MSKDLNIKEKAVFNFIKKQVIKNGYAPTVREICEETGIKSTACVYNHMVSLKKKGYIQYDTKRCRTLKIIKNNKEKTADQLFEELGYKVFVNNGFNLFEYVKHYELRPAKHIKFEIDGTITIAKENENELAVDSDYINMQELKAINQKCKEMGWLDEN